MNADLSRLAHDLEFAAGGLSARVHHALTEAGDAIVTEARELAPHGAALHYPGTITADVTLGDGRALVLEVGPDRAKNGQAKLGNIFEYGTSELAPKQHLQPAFDHQLPAIEEKIAEAGSRLL